MHIGEEEIERVERALAGHRGASASAGQCGHLPGLSAQGGARHDAFRKGYGTTAPRVPQPGCKTRLALVKTLNAIVS
jgi:hypothetical protein